MPVTIKTDEELNLMRKAGELLAQVHEELHNALRPGISTLELDAIGEEAIRKLGGIPNCKDYEGYPASVCISVNDEVVHGIPKAETILKEGDIIGIVDNSIAAVSPEVNETVEKVVRVMIEKRDIEDPIVNLYFGDAVEEDDAIALSEHLQDLFEDAEFIVARGGQPLYYYYISVE